jgi:hypothetical protein
MPLIKAFKSLPQEKKTVVDRLMLTCSVRLVNASHVHRDANRAR